MSLASLSFMEYHYPIKIVLAARTSLIMNEKEEVKQKYKIEITSHGRGHVET